MRILFLDDDPQRWEFFFEIVKKRHPLAIVHWVKTAKAAIEKLDATLEWDQIYLDHDLADFHYRNQGASESTGQDVARYLVARFRNEGVPEPVPQVVVHSWNPEGSRKMLEILDDVLPAWAERRPFGPHILI